MKMMIEYDDERFDFLSKSTTYIQKNVTTSATSGHSCPLDTIKMEISKYILELQNYPQVQEIKPLVFWQQRRALFTDVGSDSRRFSRNASVPSIRRENLLTLWTVEQRQS